MVILFPALNLNAGGYLIL